jgi:hypothetical protein
MTNQILKGLVDLIYGTERARRKFEREHPHEKVLAADASIPSGKWFAKS